MAVALDDDVLHAAAQMDAALKIAAPKAAAPENGELDTAAYAGEQNTPVLKAVALTAVALTAAALTAAALMASSLYFGGNRSFQQFSLLLEEFLFQLNLCAPFLQLLAFAQTCHTLR
nr:uncharacterized protein LOC115259793 [Aedes albopictus]